MNFLKNIIRYFLLKLRLIFIKNYLNAINALPNYENLVLLDIGAAGNIEARWKPYEQYINYIGFEPDKRSRELLKKELYKTKTFKILPYAIGKSNKETDFYLTKKEEVSSTYKPNINFLNKFPKSERFNIEKKIKMKIKKLDEIEIESPDFLKLDIQGGELNALVGAKKTLNDILGIEVEIEFLSLYTNQPLFGDVLKWLSENDFEFMDFTRICRWERKKHSEIGQAVFGDALFIKTPEILFKNKPSIDKICSYLMILVIYKRFDLIEHSLEIIPNEYKNNFSKFITKIHKLKKIEKLVQKINNFNSRLISIFGYSYKSHLIY